MKKIATIAAIATLMSSYSQISYADEFGQLVSGQQIPLTKQVKELDNSWRQVTISGQYEMGDFMRNWSGILSGNSYSYIYYTKGETVEIEDETYIVAYRLPSSPDIVSFQSLYQTAIGLGCNDASLPTQLTPQTMLNLSLLNLRTIGSLNDVRPFDFKQEVAASKQRYNAAKETCEQIQNNPFGTPETTPETPEAPESY
jgi:hypothetical protein